MITGFGDSAKPVTMPSGCKGTVTPYRMDLIDPKAILGLGRVLGEAVSPPKKYGENNWWLEGPRYHLNKALAHIYAWLDGDRQEEHLLHAFARLMMAVAKQE